MGQLIGSSALDNYVGNARHLRAQWSNLAPDRQRSIIGALIIASRSIRRERTNRLRRHQIRHFVARVVRGADLHILRLAYPAMVCRWLISFFESPPNKRTRNEGDKCAGGPSLCDVFLPTRRLTSQCFQFGARWPYRVRDIFRQRHCAGGTWLIQRSHTLGHVECAMAPLAEVRYVLSDKRGRSTRKCDANCHDEEENATEYHHASLLHWERVSDMQGTLRSVQKAS